MLVNISGLVGRAPKCLPDGKDSGLESLSAIEHGYTFEAILLNIL